MAIVGDDVDPVQGIVSAMDEYKSGVGAVRIPEVDDNVDHILDNLYNDEGIKWRLSCINEAMRPLRGGDFFSLNHGSFHHIIYSFLPIEDLPIPKK